MAVAVAMAGALACPGPRGPIEPPPPPDPPPETGPALELIESSPMETTLDHSDLRDTFQVWPDMIASARHSIDAAQFYISNAPGKLFELVVTAFEAAIARKVAVRLLVEKSFEKVYPETLARLRRAGAEVRTLDLAQVTGGVLHAKYFILDGHEAFLGSQNFDWRSLEHIQELGARVRIPAIVGGLALIFAYDWALAGGAVPPGEPAHPAPAASQPPIRLVASPQQLLPPGVAWDLPQLLELIDHAEHSVRVQVLTYRAADRGNQPWPELDDALRRAAGRGVKVQLLLADWSKREPTIGGLQRLARTPGIEIRIIDIPPWSGGFIPFARVAHTKLLAVDGRAAWIGTGNWEKDYFYKSRNVGLVIEEPALAARIDRFFETGWGSRYTEHLDPDATYEAPRIQ